MPICTAQKSNGQPCRTPAKADSDFCFFHDPESKPARSEAQRKGGSKRSQLRPMPHPAREFSLSEPDDVLQLLNYAANRIVRGELDAKTGYALGYLADCALRAYNAGNASQRLEELERLQRVESNTVIVAAGPTYESQFLEADESIENVAQEAAKNGASNTNP